MRERLFRGKSKTNGEWIKGDLLHPHMQTDCEWMIFPIDEMLNDAMAVDVSTVGQSTGRLDIMDHTVFEGDIINAPGINNAIGVVRFGNHPPHVSYLEGTSTGFYIDWQGEKYRGILRSDIGYWLDYAESVVIGNIYDNPGLLEVSEDGHE